MRREFHQNGAARDAEQLDAGIDDRPPNARRFSGGRPRRTRRAPWYGLEAVGAEV